MPKRLISQRRGKGSNVFTARKRTKANTRYVDADEKQMTGALNGLVVDLINDPGRTGIVAAITFEDGRREDIIAAEGLSVGQDVQCGKNSAIAIGNVLPLSEMPEGCPVFNIESEVGDGGSFVRSSGGYALVITKEKKRVYIKLPSGKIAALDPACRATIGCAAGGGRGEKPFVKAGRKYFAMKARGHYYPIVRGVAMNPVSHPHGGSQHHVGHSKSVSRHAPPGAKVGAIASRRTGRRKKH